MDERPGHQRSLKKRFPGVLSRKKQLLKARKRNPDAAGAHQDLPPEVNATPVAASATAPSTAVAPCDQRQAQAESPEADAAPMTGTTPPDRPLMEASVPSADAPPSADQAPRQSASKRKLAYETDSAPTYGDDQMPITIVFTGILQNLLTDLCCSVCGSNNLKLVTNADQDRGLAVCLGVVCGFCGNACSTTYTSPKLASGAFEVNRRFVASGLNLGLGCSQLQKLSEGMGMKSLSLKAHQDHQERIWESSKDHSKAVLDQAAKTVHKVYKEALYEDNQDDILDICVSYDGTWQKRGHTSKVGIGCVIDSVTGLVVDYHVMSTFCQVFFFTNGAVFHQFNCSSLSFFYPH